MKYSKGAELTAGAANTVFTVPTGYDAVVTMLFIANVGGSSKTVSATWHNGADVTFLSGKSISSGEFLQFGGETGYFLVLKEGDYITVDPEAASTFSSIISFDLNPAAPRLNV